MKYTFKNILVLASVFYVADATAQINPLAIGTIHANDSIVIVYDVTINNPLPAHTGVVKIGNQATLSGGNFANIVTDDPDTPAALDSTFTPVINLLPVTLIDFNALRQKSIVQVKWSTSQELNSDHFEVQHSSDGQTFHAIGNVPAAGYSNTEKDYSFLHTTPAKGINYYRLKQYDTDGHAVIYYIRTVKFENNEAQDIYIYPNPVTQGTINIQLSKIEKGTYMVSLYNNAGEKVSEQQISYSGSGISATVSLPKILAAGTYTLKVENDQMKMSRIILVQ
jgi:hypothetical protein